jgi:hypothetical protein
LTTSEDAAGEDEVEVSSEQLVYQFCNDETKPQSYTVFLTARRGVRAIAALPLNILVQASPSKWAAISSRVNFTVLWANAGAILSGLGSLVGVIFGIINGKKSLDARKAHAPLYIIRRSLRKALSFLGFLLVCLILFIWFTHEATVASAKAVKTAAEQSNAEVARDRDLTSQPPPSVGHPSPSGQTAPTTPGLTVINNVPSSNSASEMPTTAAPTHAASTIVIVLLTVVVLVALAVAAELVRRSIGEWPITYSARGSPFEQLRELKKLAEEEVIPRDQLEAIKEVILDRLRKQYGVFDEPRSSSPYSKERQRTDS